RPGDADFAAADRANQMYQSELFKKGWRGGEATPEQAKRAGKALNFDYSPDRNPDAPASDAEAVKVFNANRAKPTTSDEGSFGSQRFDF
ncbi:MAG TPA: hypothetical protein VM581_05140, partial [Magnetospirillaceae bacterium]|nr:hypothetical protein [Magnetospirillaceae bacterium]